MKNYVIWNLWISIVSVRPSFLFLTHSPWINLIAKYIYGFLLTRQRYSDHFKLKVKVCLKSFICHILKSVLPNIMQCGLPNTILKKWPSEYAAMCPSKHELCVVPNMTQKLRNKGSPFQLAPKPTHTRRASVMGPKAPNMRVSLCHRIDS